MYCQLHLFTMRANDSVRPECMPASAKVSGNAPASGGSYISLITSFPPIMADLEEIVGTP
jgi:hypothetical protein